MKIKVAKINKVEELNKQEERSKIDEERLSRELKLLHEFIFLEAEKEFKANFSNNAIANFLTSIKNSTDKKTGAKSKPNDIGFASLVKKRLDRLKWNIEINELLDETKQEDTHKLGYLPNKGEVFLTTKIIVLSEETYTESPFDKNKIVKNREIMKKIRGFSIKSYEGKINSYFKKDEKIDGAEFVNQVIRTYPESLKEYPDNKPYPGMVLKHMNGNKVPYNPSEGEKSILSIVAILENSEYDCYLFDEMERGLGNKYIANYVIPVLKKLRDSGKTLIIATHNANIAINTLPSQSIYCRYPNEKGNYMTGNMYSNELINFKDNLENESWEPLAIEHLEGNENMFLRRKNIWNY